LPQKNALFSFQLNFKIVPYYKTLFILNLFFFHKNYKKRSFSSANAFLLSSATAFLFFDSNGQFFGFIQAMRRNWLRIGIESELNRELNLARFVFPHFNFVLACLARGAI
jgi:hypothetical protein